MLPPQHLERVVEQDFNLSSLAEELNTVGDDVSAKVETIQSLQDIAPQYDGEEQIEVRHQIIEGKKSYIELGGCTDVFTASAFLQKFAYIKDF